MRKALKFSVVVVLLFAVWVLLLLQWFDSVKPGGQTLQAHLAKSPATDRQCVFTAGGQEYLALFGRVRALPAFPSGPPVYIFDRAGRLVDWTWDEGDAPDFHRQWPSAFSGRKINAAEVAEWRDAAK